MTLFVDSDVILDTLLKREPFNIYSSIILDLSNHDRELNIVTSSICIANITYIIRKNFSLDETKSILINLLKGIELIDISKSSINSALTSNFKDLEDAYQYYSCIEHKADHIITRNKKDYTESEIPVKSPVEYLSGK